MRDNNITANVAEGKSHQSGAQLYRQYR